jgi:hypothetical protein
MNKNFNDFRDGRIEGISTTPYSVKATIMCAAVECGELVVHISSNSNGRLHLSFSGLGERVIKTEQIAANTLTIMVKDEV